MKKFFISMSVLLTIAISLPVISSARSADDGCPATATCVNDDATCKKKTDCDRRSCHKGDAGRRKCHKGDAGRRGADGCFAPFLFDGIQLSDAQKADLQVLRSNLKKERKDFNDATKAAQSLKNVRCVRNRRRNSTKVSKHSHQRAIFQIGKTRPKWNRGAKRHVRVKSKSRPAPAPPKAAKPAEE